MKNTFWIRIVSLVLSIQLAVQPVLGTFAQSFAGDSTPSSSRQIGLQGDKSGSLEAAAEALAGYLNGDTDSNDLDPDRLLLQTAFKTGLKNSEIRPHLVVADFSQTDSTGFAGFDLNYHGVPFLRYGGAVKTAIAFDSYIVIEPAAEKGKSKDLYFMDLRTYSKALGVTKIPLFKIPMPQSQQGASDSESQSLGLRMEGNVLYYGGTKVSTPILRFFSDLGQLSFNFRVNLTDPETLKDAGPWIDEFDESYLKALELHGKNGESEIENFLAYEKEALDLGIETKKNLVQSRDELKAALKAKVTSHETFRKTIKDVAANYTAQRPLGARLRMLWARLSFPQPVGAPKLESALYHVLGSVKGRENIAEKRSLREGLLQLLNHRGIQLTALALGAYAAGTFLPRETAEFLKTGLEIGHTGLSFVMDKLKDTWTLAVESLEASFAGFNPANLYETYFREGRRAKTIIGMTAMMTTLYIILGIPHLIINTTMLARDLKKSGWKEKGFVQTFIDRENSEEREYLKSLSESAQEEIAADSDDEALSSKIVFTAEDTAEVEKIIEAENVKSESKWKKWFHRVTSLKIFKRTEKKSEREMTTFFQALKHFLFSYSSFTNSGYAYTKIWNFLYAWRSFVWKPMTLVTLVAYPNYYKAATALENDVKIPNLWDGGKRSILQWARMQIFSPSTLAKYKAWEEKFLAVEQEFHAEALARASKAALEYAESMDDLKALSSAISIKSLNDPVLEKLTRRQRNFFKSYYSTLIEEGLSDFLRETLATENPSKFPSDAELKDAEVKAALVETWSEPKVLKGDVKRIFDEIESSGEAFVKADDFSKSSTLSFELIRNKIQNKVLASLDARTVPQVARMKSVERMMENPSAMARAVRSMIASVVVDKPMELALMFVMLAGVSGGVMQPIHDEMFGKDSWFYLSRYMFLAGYAFNVVQSVLADVWLKLQYDEKNEGKFNNVPKDGDANISYLGWFRKQTFSNPENSWWSNQLYTMKLYMANLLPTLSMMLLVDMLTLGRLDADGFIVGYLTAVALPLSGFAMKLEQGFELSSGWFAKIFPERLRSHPEAQNHLNKAVGNARIKFNIFYKLYENLIWGWVGNFSMMNSTDLGSRAFSRILLGGYSFTEFAVQGFRSMNEALGFIPGVSWLMESCEVFLSRNFTGFEKIPSTEEYYKRGK